MDFPALKVMSDLELVVLLKATTDALNLRHSDSDERFKNEILQELKRR